MHLREGGFGARGFATLGKTSDDILKGLARLG